MIIDLKRCYSLFSVWIDKSILVVIAAPGHCDCQQALIYRICKNKLIRIQSWIFHGASNFALPLQDSIQSHIGLAPHPRNLISPTQGQILSLKFQPTNQTHSQRITTPTLDTYNRWFGWNFATWPPWWLPRSWAQGRDSGAKSGRKNASKLMWFIAW